MIVLKFQVCSISSFWEEDFWKKLATDDDDVGIVMAIASSPGEL